MESTGHDAEMRQEAARVARSTPVNCLKLFFGTSPEVWQNLQCQYEIDKAKEGLWDKVKAATASRRMVAARVATVLVGLGVVALAFVMRYAQGADDLFNLSNKVFGVFLPPIAIPMLCGVFVKRFSKRAGMTGLVGGIAVGLALFVAGGWHPFLREMVWIFPATAVATIAFLALGTVLFPDNAEERREVEAFFRQIETPDRTEA